MKVSTTNVRVGAIVIIWLLWTLIMAVNIPELGATDTAAFGGMAILWMVATMLGGMVGVIALWEYFWGHAGAIADWINEQIAR